VPVRAQHRISQLEQRIHPRSQTPVRLTAEGRQPTQRPVISRLPLDPGPQPRHTERHGNRLHLHVLSKEPKMITRGPAYVMTTRRRPDSRG